MADLITASRSLRRTKYIERPKHDSRRNRYGRVVLVFCLGAGLLICSPPSSYGEDWLTLIKRADSLSRLQEFDSAIVCAKAALEIRLQEHGPVDSSAAGILNRLGDYSYDRADFEAAGSYYTQALEMRLEIFGESHVRVASSLDRLATLLSYLEQLDSATVLFEKALDVFEQTLGPDHPQLGGVLNNMAMIMSKRAAYAEASIHYLRAIEIEEQGENPSLYRLTAYRNNLAVVYLNQHDYDRAVDNYVEIVKTQELLSGNEDAALIPYLTNLGIAYQRQGDLVKAESVFRRDYNLSKEKLGAEHTETANCAHNLASCLRDIEKYEESEIFFGEALAIREKILGADHPLTSSTAIEQSGMYMAVGKLDEAGEILEGRQGYDTVSTLRSTPIEAENLLYYWRYLSLRDNHQRAFQVAQIAFESVAKHFQANSWVLPEEDALKLASLSRRAAHKCISSLISLEKPVATDIEKATEVILRTKGQVSDEIFERRRLLTTESDPVISGLAEAYTEQKRNLAQLYVRGRGDQNESDYRELLDSLTEMVTALESNLARKSASFKPRQDSRNITTENIRRSLPDDAVLVEYLKYSYELPGADQSEFRYLVAVIDHDEPARITDLGSGDRIDSLVVAYREHLLKLSSASHAPLMADSKEYSQIAAALYQAVLEPIRKQLSKRSIILLAPDGTLNLVSFAGLIDNSGKYLVETHAVHYLSSGRELARMKSSYPAGKGLLAIGNPDYDASPAERLSQEESRRFAGIEETEHAGPNLRSGCDYFRGIRLQSLPGTEREVERIKEGWMAAQSEKAEAWTGAAATEDILKASAPGKRIVHLATHGYYVSGQCESPDGNGIQSGFAPDIVGENPLLLSGLFFAGANLHGEGSEEAGIEDGVLTAYEVSAIDLRGVQMVVLSACETGLGKVREGEGVYGLRKAFQLAGARTVVSALWPVPDKQTAAIMSKLYSTGNTSLPETLRQIQLDRIATLRSQGLADHPYSWGAFIALGDWR